MANGNFIISLDFELHWGGVEKWDIQKKTNYFLESRKSIPEVLDLFETNNIQATWATVGLLFGKNKKQLEKFSPKLKPTYLNKKLSYYNYFSNIGNNENEDPFHYGGNLINQIVKTEGQELACHTFSHFYCNEKGQTIEQFDQDLKSAQLIAKENYGITLKSLVFPRNQFNRDYLDVAINNGIRVVRSNPNVWFWKNTSKKVAPFLRAIDTLIPISKHLSFDDLDTYNNLKILPASRFFRPYKNSESIIQTIKMFRIKNEMSHAAKYNKNYHLWWHPHNFGENINENIAQLNDIIKHFQILNNRYNFVSTNMINFANK